MSAQELRTAHRTENVPLVSQEIRQFLQSKGAREKSLMEQERAARREALMSMGAIELKRKRKLE